MLILLRRLVMMTVMSWLMGKAVNRWPRLSMAQRALGGRRF